MIFAVDVYYKENIAKSVGLLFKKWSDSEPFEIVSSYTQDPQEYEPGHFYKRELPCIMELLKHTNIKAIDIIIIDGYVYLSNDKKAGLGYHLYTCLNKKIPVIGVAKTAFYSNSGNEIVMETYRGKSSKPLFITAEGIELDFAAGCIKEMHGEYRIPTLLKLLDTHTKNT